MDLDCLRGASTIIAIECNGFQAELCFEDLDLDAVMCQPLHANGLEHELEPKYLFLLE